MSFNNASQYSADEGSKHIPTDEYYMTLAIDQLNYEPNFLFKEFAANQEARIRANSRFGHLKTWKLARVIVKSGDDMRLE